EKSAVANEVGRHEAVAVPPEPFEPVRNHRVVRHASIVHGDRKRRHSSIGRDTQTEAGQARRLQPKLREAGQLTLEFLQRELVAVGAGRREAALAGMPDVDVMKQQGGQLHEKLSSQMSSSVSKTSAEADP